METPNPIYITGVYARNILGIKEFEFTPGKANVFCGPSGTNKTSLLETLVMFANGSPTGHDASILNTGAADGEFCHTLSNGYTITKKVTADATKLEIRDAAGKLVKSPATYIKTLLGEMFSPIKFVLAKDKKERVDLLLKALPMDCDFDRLSEIMGAPVTRVDVHPLVLIDSLYDRMYSARRDVNADIDQKKKFVSELSAMVPPEPRGSIDHEACAAGIESADATRRSNIDKIDKRMREREAEYSENTGKIKDAARAEEKAVTDEYEELIRKLREECAVKVAAIAEKRNADLLTASQELDGRRALADKMRGEINDAHKAATQDLKEMLRMHTENMQAEAKRKVTVDAIASRTSEIETSERKRDTLQGSMDSLKAYKVELLETLPIPGLEVRDGDLFYSDSEHKDVQFDRVNTSMRIRIAVKIAMLTSGTMPIIAVDGMECLDSKTFAEFRVELMATKYQLFCTRVTDDEGFNVQVFS